MGIFITFEGIEGCGKTTQIRMAADHLSEAGIPVLVTAEPGGAPLGMRIRELLLNRGRCRIDARAELLLFCAARAQHVQELILPALQAGKWVLCDRFTDATLAYQGFGRGLDIETISTLNEFSTAALTPDRTILFDLPVEIGLGRAMDRIARLGAGTPREDRFEREERAFHQRIREGYLSLAEREPGRFRRIDASRDEQAISGEVSRLLMEMLDP